MNRRHGLLLLCLLLAAGDATAGDGAELNAAVTIGRIAKVALPDGHRFHFRLPDPGTQVPRKAVATLPFRVRTNTAFEMTVVPRPRGTAAGAPARLGAATRERDSLVLPYGAAIVVEAAATGPDACRSRTTPAPLPTTPWRTRIDPSATGMQFEGVLCFYARARAMNDEAVRGGRYTGGVSIDVRVLSE